MAGNRRDRSGKMNNRKQVYTAVLSIAGSDSGGGAGIQADLKTFSALGCYGTTAITAVTVQNTLGVTGIHSIPADIVEAQIRAVLEDIRPKAVKIGMVPTAETGRRIAAVLTGYPEIPGIFDPVMVSSSGKPLMTEETISMLAGSLFPLMQLITPNLDEAALLTGREITSIADMTEAGRILLKMGCRAVLIKGGHLKAEQIYDVLVEQGDRCSIFNSAYVPSKNLHGTGCTLSSAIAAYSAMGNPLPAAVSKARAYVHEAIVHGTQATTGGGQGPLNHFFNPQKLQACHRGCR